MSQLDGMQDPMPVPFTEASLSQLLQARGQEEATRKSFPQFYEVSNTLRKSQGEAIVGPPAEMAPPAFGFASFGEAGDFRDPSRPGGKNCRPGSAGRCSQHLSPAQGPKGMCMGPRPELFEPRRRAVSKELVSCRWICWSGFAARQDADYVSTYLHSPMHGVFVQIGRPLFASLRYGARRPWHVVFPASRLARGTLPSRS